MIQNCNGPRTWRVAATSCVWPDTAAGNCRRLARTVPEVGLYLLELASCLAYGPQDLPRHADGLAYHLHLPLDLPWERGGEGAFSAMAGLLEKTAHLSPWAMVLHPPARPADLEAFLAALCAAGGDPATLLVENTEDVSPEEVLDLAATAGCGVCLDLGHMLAMGHRLPARQAELAARVGMLHVYAPFGEEGPLAGRRHAHRPLTCLSPEGRDVLVWMLETLRPRTVVAEVFAPGHLVESLAMLDALACGEKPAADRGARS